MSLFSNYKNFYLIDVFTEDVEINSLTKIYRLQDIDCIKVFFQYRVVLKIVRFCYSPVRENKYLKTNQDNLTVVSFKTALRLKHTLF